MPPVRSCILTRERADPDALVRLFVGPDGQAHVDWHGRWKGRGAWLTCTRAAFEELAKKPGLLARALEVPSLDVSGLLAEAREANHAAVLDLLALSARAGALVSGADALAGTAPESILALVVASDAAQGSTTAATAQFPAVPVHLARLDREALGHRIGKGPRAVVGVRAAAPTRALLRELRRAHDLG